MPSLRFSAFALESMRSLPKDSSLLKAIWKQLEDVATDPAKHSTTPPPFPHRQDRHLCELIAYDLAGNKWQGFALLEVTPDVVTVTSINVVLSNSDVSE